MILYIGWTNLMLLNIYNIQSSINKDKEAIVLIIDSSSVDPEIADYFIKSKTFVNTFIAPTQLTLSKYTTRKSKIRHLPEVLFYSKNILRYYAATIPVGFSGFDFDEVYVPGFFYNIVLFLEIINKNNKIKNIKLYEFGLGTYTYEIETLMKNIEFMSTKDYLIRLANEYPYRIKFSKRLSKEIFVYEPSLLHANVTYDSVAIEKMGTASEEQILEDDNLEIERLNDHGFFAELAREQAAVPYIPRDHFITSMFRNIPNHVRVAIKNHNIIYFSSYGPGSDEEQKLFVNLLQLVRPQDIMLKTHTQAPSLFKPLLSKFGSRCFVDTNIYLFEALLSRYDFSNKILINRLSSAVFHQKLIFGQEPVVILTYKLFQIYKDIGNNLLDELILRIKSIYSIPERIMVPTSLLEFKLMVKRAQKMVYNAIYQVGDLTAKDDENLAFPDTIDDSGDETDVDDLELDQFGVLDEDLVELLDDDSEMELADNSESSDLADESTIE